MVQIYDTDTIFQVGRKIYENLEINCSISVFGTSIDKEAEKVVPRGELVIKELERRYDEEYIDIKAGKRIRKFKYRNQSVGGPILHPIFTWEKRIVDGDIRYTIWRVQ